MPKFKPNITKVKPAGSIQARLRAAQTLVAEDRLDEALREAEAVLKVDANSRQGHMAAGRIRFRQKQYAEARRHFEEAIRIDHLKPRPYLWAARVCLLQGDLDRALAHAQDAVRLNPKSYVAYMVVGQVHFRKGDFQGARESFARAQSLNPRSVPVRHQLAQAAAQGGDHDGAVEVLTEALRIDPDRADTYERLGRIQLLRADYPGARSAYEKALSLDPDLDAAARLGLAEANIEDGQIEAAEAALREVTARATTKARFHKLWGDVYHAREDYPSAVEEYRAAELMLADAEAGQELAIDEKPDLPARDPKWKSLSDAHRERAASLVERRREQRQAQAAEGALDREVDAAGD